MSKNELARAGTICEECYKRWVHQGLEPKTLTYIYDSDGAMITTDGGTPIVVCPYCDGEPIITLSKHREDE